MNPKDPQRDQPWLVSVVVNNGNEHWELKIAAASNGFGRESEGMVEDLICIAYHVVVISFSAYLGGQLIL